MSDMQENLRQFNLAIGDFSKSIPDQVRMITRKIALEGLRRLVQKTPVDTGRARNNWQAVALQGTDIVVALRKRAEREQQFDKTGAEALRKGAAVIAQMPAFAIIDIQNNVEYILDLEDGHSKQAPNGMLTVTLEELSRMIVS